MIWSELRGALTVVAAGGVLAVAVAAQDWGVSALSAMESLRFHIVAIPVGAAVALLFTGAFWRALLAVGVTAILITPGALALMEQQALRDDFDPNAPGATIRVLSFNLLVENERGEEIAAFVEELAPDIAILLEAPGLGAGSARMARNYPHRAGCDADAECDIVIYSREPLTDVVVHTLQPSRLQRLVVANVTIRGVDLAVAAVHLSKPYFDGMLTGDLPQIEFHTRNVGRPLLVAGDFNAAPWSASMLAFVEKARLVPPPSYPATWPVALGGLGLPIDNMFTRDGLVIETIAAMEDSIGSNHRGLVATLRVVPAEGLEPPTP